MKYKYNGTDERVFPNVGVTVKPGDEFEAPEGFVAKDVTPAGAKPAFTKESETTKVSVTTDKKLGE